LCARCDGSSGSRSKIKDTLFRFYSYPLDRDLSGAPLFTALIIGILGDENDIDPVVVSSCIFMEDERAETQADGILEKVCVSC
jgi:hypothetical protein